MQQTDSCTASNFTPKPHLLMPSTLLHPSRDTAETRLARQAAEPRPYHVVRLKLPNSHQTASSPHRHQGNRPALPHHTKHITIYSSKQRRHWFTCVPSSRSQPRVRHVARCMCCSNRSLRAHPQPPAALASSTNTRKTSSYSVAPDSRNAVVGPGCQHPETTENHQNTGLPRTHPRR